MMGGVTVIGGAIIPELTRFVNWIIRGTAAARDWIKDHKGLVVTALQVTGAIVAGGLAFSVLAKVLGMLGSGVGLLLVPFRVLGGLVGTVGSVLATAFSAVVGTISAVGATLAFLLTPMGLLIGAAVALAGYFLWSSGAIGGGWTGSRASSAVWRMTPEKPSAGSAMPWPPATSAWPPRSCGPCSSWSGKRDLRPRRALGGF